MNERTSGSPGEPSFAAAWQPLANLLENYATTEERDVEKPLSLSRMASEWWTGRYILFLLPQPGGLPQIALISAAVTVVVLLVLH